MKKILLATLAIALAVSTLSASRTYECSRYVDGKPTGGHTNVKASSVDEAIPKSTQQISQ